MKRLVCVEPGRFEFEEVALPEPQAGESLIKIRKLGICGTDLHAFAGRQPYFTYPRVLGHEIAAEYVRGDAEGFSPGDKLTVIPYFTKGEDIASRMGKPNCSTDMSVCGVHQDGAMAEYLVVPSYALIKEEGLDDDALVLTEPLAIGAHGIARGSLIPGEFVLVIGAGPIGLGIIKLANIAGGKVIAMDIDPGRLEVASRLGASFTILASAADVKAQLAGITNGDMPTLIFDATGNRAAINGALDFLAHGGRYVLVGLQKEELVFSHPEFHKRETTLMSSRNAVIKDFKHVLSCIKNGDINPEDFITQRIAFDTVPEAFANKSVYTGIKTIIEFS